MNYSELNSLIKKKLVEYDADFRRKHEGNLDFGDCGSAVVLVAFGRKRKLKNEAEEAGFLGMGWSSAAKKSFTFEFPSGTVPTQYSGYYRERARIVASLVRDFYEGTGVEVNVHSWTD